MTGDVPEQGKIIHHRLGRRHLSAPPLEHIAVQNKTPHGCLFPTVHVPHRLAAVSSPLPFRAGPAARYPVSFLPRSAFLPFLLSASFVVYFPPSALPQNFPSHLLQHRRVRQEVARVEKIHELPLCPAHRKIHGVIDAAVLSRKNPDPRIRRTLLQRSVR